MNADTPEPDRAGDAPHPRRAPTVIGQGAAERAFLAAWGSSRLHHAWLITGPRGVGKATLAWRMARALLAAPALCVPAVLDVATDHPVALRMAALSEPRLFLLRRPWLAKDKRLATVITVDPVRALRQFLTLSAADGGRRCVIVDAADDLNVQAANALLKLLEEPPAGVTFLLVCHAPTRLLPTIRSRCRTLRCHPLGAADMASALAGIGAAAAVPADVPAAVLAELAGGSVGEAVRLVETGGPATYAALIDLLRGAPGLDRAALLRLANGLAGAAGAARYDTTVRLIDLLLSRLARSGAGVLPATEAARGEAAVLARLSPDEIAARGWAALHGATGARIRHARAVNLDPSGVILDTVLAIDEAARATATA